MLQVSLGIKLHLSISQFDCLDVPHAAITHFNFISVDYLVNPKTAGGYDFPNQYYLYFPIASTIAYMVVSLFD